jgi:putative transposase
MAETPQFTEREVRIARVLRSLGKEPLTRQQAETAAKLLGVHRSTVYRLRKRFLQRSLTSAVAPKPPGQNPGSKRLDARVERVIQLVLSDWLPRQRQLAHSLLDICVEVWRCCHLAELAPPGRNTVSRRWAAHREAQAAVLANDPAALVAPGSTPGHRPDRPHASRRIPGR